MPESAETPRRSLDIDIEYLLKRGQRMRVRPDSTLRVSDAERNAVADKLSRHYADGRLDESEFKERLDAAMSAKTQGDLAGLFDLSLIHISTAWTPRGVGAGRRRWPSGGHRSRRTSPCWATCSRGSPPPSHERLHKTCLLYTSRCV